MMDVALSTKALTKRFNDALALDGITMSVPKGSVYGLVGQNGAGKSTLLAIAAGALRATSGETLAFGVPVFNSPEAKARIAWIPSEPYFLMGEDLRGMAAFLATTYPTFSERRCKQLAVTLGLDRKKPLRKLSKGMQRRAAFALALAINPELLLLDEPMDGLDPMVRRTVWKLILGEVAEKGLTVLISSHNLRELEGVCDHLGILDKGRMKYEANLNDPATELTKVQIVIPEEASLPEELAIRSQSTAGRMHTLVIQGDAEKVRATLTSTHPLYLQLQPLSLEELFLFEMGGSHEELDDLTS